MERSISFYARIDRVFIDNFLRDRALQIKGNNSITLLTIVTILYYYYIKFFVDQGRELIQLRVFIDRHFFVEKFFTRSLIVLQREGK